MNRFQEELLQQAEKMYETDKTGMHEFDNFRHGLLEELKKQKEQGKCKYPELILSVKLQWAMFEYAKLSDKYNKLKQAARKLTGEFETELEFDEAVSEVKSLL